MTTEPPVSSAARRGLRRWPILAVAGVMVAVVAVLVTLHVRSGDPGTAKRQPVSKGNDRSANSQIVRRADRLVTALKNGDTATIQSLAYGSTDRVQVAPLVVAFGNRPGISGHVQVDEFGGRNGVLTVSVPCQSSQPQQVIISFDWKRNQLDQLWLVRRYQPTRHSRSSY